MATSLAVAHIGEEEWSHHTSVGDAPSLRLHSSPSNDLWESAIDEIVALLNLGENWDGLGAKPPTREVAAAAIGLAYLLQERGAEPPTRIVPGPQGSIVLERQEADGTYCEVEVLRPLYAEVMLIEPGKPPQHWTIPDGA